jgi:phosphoribosylformimino-5-aminoimidazole carboxamide ribotide isomerase
VTNPAFQIFPAIDLKDGKCVRLVQGLAESATVYGEDPLQMALNWVAQGATYLHVVDLDGAFTGEPRHTELIGRIARAVPVPVQVGGGLRTDESIERLLGEGVARAIIGTRVLSEPEALTRLVRRFGDRLAVGIDARGGRVQVKGWKETSIHTVEDVAAMAAAAGVGTLIYTDTATDGMLQGTSVASVGALCDAVACRVIASGGVSGARDILSLCELAKPNLAGVIVGKALYEGKVSLVELLRASAVT